VLVSEKGKGVRNSEKVPGEKGTVWRIKRTGGGGASIQWNRTTSREWLKEYKGGRVSKKALSKRGGGLKGKKSPAGPARVMVESMGKLRITYSGSMDRGKGEKEGPKIHVMCVVGGEKFLEQNRRCKGGKEEACGAKKKQRKLEVKG